AGAIVFGALIYGLFSGRSRQRLHQAMMSRALNSNSDQTPDSSPLAQSLSQLGQVPAAPVPPVPPVVSLPPVSPVMRTASSPAPPPLPAMHTLSAVTATATARMGGPAESRASTWSDRRLFSDFSGTEFRHDPRYRLTTDQLPIPEDDYVFGAATPAMAQLLPESETRRGTQRQNLTAAGYRSRAAWTNLAAIRFGLAFAALCAVGFWLIMAPPAMENFLLAAVAIVPVLMWAIPPLFVASQANDRRLDIERGLPDLLDMLNMGVSQGLSIPQSLRRITHEIHSAHPALADELEVVTRQAEVSTVSHALQNFRERIDSPEVSSFASLIMQAELTGTSISRSLAEYSDSIRGSLRERADARANAASFKLLFPVALCLMPSVFLFLLGPAVVTLTDFFTNQASQIQQNRDAAINTLDNAPPPIDFSRFDQNSF
ncbi:MAG: type II secretion system F family protein, partial [Planctomycetaceae bacterium]|nr:type II secretion system F family protein [Planctomycetaceae bacterium]